MLSNYFHKDAEVEDYLDKYNDDFPMAHEVFVRFENTITDISSLELSRNSRAWKKVDFYNLLIEIDRKLFKEHLQPEKGPFKIALTELYSEVDAA